jgi:hypothetical protein
LAQLRLYCFQLAFERSVIVSHIEAMLVAGVGRG